MKTQRFHPLEVEAAFLSCAAPRSLDEFVDLISFMDSIDMPIRPVREVVGRDPDRRQGLEVHPVPASKCTQCEERRTRPESGLHPEWEKYVVHPEPGEPILTAIARRQPRGTASEFYRFSSRRAILDEAGYRAARLRNPSEGNGDMSSTIKLFYAPDSWERIGKFPEELGVVDGWNERTMPSTARSAGAFDWEWLAGFQSCNLTVGGVMFSDPGAVSRDAVLAGYMSALRTMVLKLVPRVRPELASCGESMSPEASHFPKRQDRLVVNWVNVFGPAYVDTYGRDFLLNAPGFLTEELAGGFILYQVTNEFGPRGAENPPPHEVERYFAAHPAIRKVRYRPRLRQALPSGGA